MLTAVRWISLCLAFLLSNVAHAQSVQDLPGTTRFNSRHYDITTDLPPAQARELAEHMDAVHAEYSKRFAAYGKRNAEPLRLWVFKEQRGYAEFLAQFAINATGSGGMFFRNSRARGLVSFLGQRNMETMFETLRHEGMHQFLYQRIGDNIPTWLNEGLAEWFGYAMPTRRGFLMGLTHPRALGAMQSAVNGGRAIPLGELLTMDHGTWNARVQAGDASLQYNQSWSVVHFLVYAENGRYEPMLSNLLRQLWQGVEQRTAVERAFGDDLAPMQEAWERYVKEIQPDEMYRAHAMLSAHAELLSALAKLDVRPKTQTAFDEALVEHAAALELPPHLITRYTQQTLTLDDDAWWRTPPTAGRSGRAATVRFLPDRRDRTPPAVELRGLKSKARLLWNLSRDGELSWSIEIG